MGITLLKLGPDGLPLDATPNLPGVNLAIANYSDYGMVAPPDRARLIRGGLYAAITLMWVALAVMMGLGWMNRMRSTSEPLDPQYQRMYVTVVAQRYSRTSDLARAQRDLIQWREEDLAQLLAAMQEETRDPGMRTQLAALATALRLPEPQVPTLERLFRRENILIGLVFVSLLVVVGMGMIPHRRPVTHQHLVEELPFEVPRAEIIEELLPDIRIEKPIPPRQEEPGEGEKKPVEPAIESRVEEKTIGLGDLSSLFGEEDPAG